MRQASRAHLLPDLACRPSRSSRPSALPRPSFGAMMASPSGIPDGEAAMCLRSEYDLYARTKSKPVRSKPARSLVEVLRDLFRPRRPQVERAAVIPFSAERTACTDKEVDRDSSKAA